MIRAIAGFLLVLLSGCTWDVNKDALLSAPVKGQAPALEQTRTKGIMEKKYEMLKSDMTKEEVEAILGKPSGCIRGGGSFSSCEQYRYVWNGDDGLIYIDFAKSGAAPYTSWGPPEQYLRVRTMNWQPEIKHAD